MLLNSIHGVFVYPIIFKEDKFMKNVLIDTTNLSREEWLNYRRQGIGGSDVAVICGLSKYKSAVELWMEKTGQLEPKEAGEAAYWGNVMESIIRNEFTLRTNLNVRLVPSILQHPVHSFMLANLDGIVDEPVCGECIFEAKTASAYKQEQWEAGIPEEYMLQLQHYFAVTGFQRAFIAVLIGGNQFKYKVVDRDEEIIAMIIKLEEHFWHCVTANTPPEMDGTEASTELLNRLYPESNAGKQIVLPPEAADLVTQFELSKAKEKEASEMKDEASNKLKSMLGENESGAVAGRIVAWKSVSSEKFDSKKLQQHEPDVYSKYLYSSSYRRFSIK